MKKLSVLLLFILLLIGTVVPASAQGEQTIVEIAQGNDQFETLVGALQQAGLVETLQGEGPFTVFAPTDDAFAALPEGTLESLDTETLASILTYHVVPGEVTAEQAVAMAPTEVTTVQGEPLQVTVENGMVMVNGATVVTADIQASNGVIHVIDSVLLPPSVQAAMSGDTAAGAAAPQALPETGGSSTLPLLPVSALVLGLLLVAGAYVLRPRLS